MTHLIDPPSLRRTLPADAVAGISVALVLIPQSLAYAEIAGVPTHLGLFAASLPLLFHAPFGSSPYLQTGPVALTSLLTFGALADLAEPGSTHYVKLAALLAFVVGVVRLVLGSARLGRVAYVMSDAVVTGFTAAAAILISASQLPAALGSTSHSGSVLVRGVRTLLHPEDWSLEAFAISVATLAVVVLGRRVGGTRFPAVLIAALGGLLYSAVSGYGGAVVGSIPAGFPSLGFDLPWDDTGAVVISGIVIALVGFAEPASICRQLAAEDNTTWNASRELFASGLANLASAASGAFPVGGSFSRSSLNKLAGAKTRMSGVIVALAVLAFLPVSGVLEDLPRATLGAIVISAVYRLVDPTRFKETLRRDRPDGIIALLTFAGTLAAAPRVDRAVVAAVVMSVVVGIVRRRHGPRLS